MILNGPLTTEEREILEKKIRKKRIIEEIIKKFFRNLNKTLRMFCWALLKSLKVGIRKSVWVVDRWVMLSILLAATARNGHKWTKNSILENSLRWWLAWGQFYFHFKWSKPDYKWFYASFRVQNQYFSQFQNKADAQYSGTYDAIKKIARREGLNGESLYNSNINPSKEKQKIVSFYKYNMRDETIIDICFAIESEFQFLPTYL